MPAWVLHMLCRRNEQWRTAARLGRREDEREDGRFDGTRRLWLSEEWLREANEATDEANLLWEEALGKEARQQNAARAVCRRSWTL